MEAGGFDFRPWRAKLFSLFAVGGEIWYGYRGMGVLSAQQEQEMMAINDVAQAAYQTLLLADGFEENFIGFAANPSKLVAAYGVLLQQAEADEVFKQLLKQATPAGQLYALCGLYFTDYPFFLAAVEAYRNRADCVNIQSGCLCWGKPVSEIVEQKSPNAVRLSDPHQSLAVWYREHPTCTGIDIIGGGYPHLFRPLFSRG